MEVLKAESIAKSYGGVEVLRDVSFVLASGEYAALIGPNGAGKSTLFSIIAGDNKASGGKVYLRGADVTKMPTHWRIHHGIGRSFQISNVFLDLSVLTNAQLAVQGIHRARFGFFREFRSNRDCRSKAATLLESLGLLDRRDDLASELAHGQLRRLDIAMALASDPQVLLLDEPSAGLTQGESAELQRLIRGASAARELAVLFVAHDMDLVAGFAHRVLVLASGKVIADGTPAEIMGNTAVRDVYLGA